MKVYTVGQLAARVTGGNERTMRKLLNDAGGARYDEYANDPDEPVSREQVVDLLALRAGDRVGRVLAAVLREG